MKLGERPAFCCIGVSSFITNSRHNNYLVAVFVKYRPIQTKVRIRGAGVAEWARVLTGDRTVNGSSPAAVNIFRFASELWQFRLPRLASVFRMRH